MSHKQKVSIYLHIRLDGKQRFWPTVRLFAGEGDRATLIRVSLIVLEGVEELFGVFAAKFACGSPLVNAGRRQLGLRAWDLADARIFFDHASANCERCLLEVLLIFG